MVDEDERGRLLAEHAAEYAAVALANVQREYPYDLRYLVTGPDELRSSRDLHPVFYGSFDWHSSVEMHWVLLRLLRLAPGTLTADTPGEQGQPRSAAAVRAVLDQQLSASALAVEAAYFADPARRTEQRPYGWGWAFWLAEEAAGWDDPDARRWAANLRPLVTVLAEHLVGWLPRATYPVRHGVHSNSAFGVARALPWARRLAAEGDQGLLSEIVRTARRWYLRDVDYPAGWEPSGADFLSPALVEAELMAQILSPAQFPGWLRAFLPGLADGAPASLFEPATVSDATDGQIGHLHGLNLSRAWAWRRLAETLPEADPRRNRALLAARRHAEAALPKVTGSDYLVEHWLACYALLYLSC